MGNKDFLRHVTDSITEQEAGDLLEQLPAVFTIGNGEYMRRHGKLVDVGGEPTASSGVPRITRMRIATAEEAKVWGHGKAVSRTPTGSVPSIHQRTQHEMSVAGENVPRIMPADAVKSTADGEFHRREQNAHIQARRKEHTMSEKVHEDERKVVPPPAPPPAKEGTIQQGLAPGQAPQAREIGLHEPGTHNRPSHPQETTPTGVGPIKENWAAINPNVDPEAKKMHSQDTTPAGGGENVAKVD